MYSSTSSISKISSSESELILTIEATNTSDRAAKRRAYQRNTCELDCRKAKSAREKTLTLVRDQRWMLTKEIMFTAHTLSVCGCGPANLPSEPCNAPARCRPHARKLCNLENRSLSDLHVFPFALNSRFMKENLSYQFSRQIKRFLII